MNYQKFKESFEASGLSQSNYGKSIGISSPMVSHYLNKARKEMTGESGFSRIEVESRSDRTIIIRTSSGIEIPI